METGSTELRSRGSETVCSPMGEDSSMRSMDEGATVTVSSAGISAPIMPTASKKSSPRAIKQPRRAARRLFRNFIMSYIKIIPTKIRKCTIFASENLI